MSIGYHRLGGRGHAWDNRLNGAMPGVVIQATLIQDEPTPRATFPKLAETQLGPGVMDTKQARTMGYTGDQCSMCFSMKMKVSGHCTVCEDCGTTTGCS